jgi:UDP-GlcNAc:undecaprenyl-phosphate GlcNAc-1-phosphate transferase
MGDAGSLFLGVLLATLSIRLAPMTETAIASFAIPVMLLAIPILDTSVAVISRLRRRVSPFLGGKDHLSHRLIRFGFSRQITAAVLWSLSLLFGLITLLVTSINKYHEVKIVFGAVVLWLVLFIKFINTSDQ